MLSQEPLTPKKSREGWFYPLTCNYTTCYYCIPLPVQCKLCGSLVLSAGTDETGGKLNHAGSEHMSALLQCPVLECNFHVEGDFPRTIAALGKHLRVNSLIISIICVWLIGRVHTFKYNHGGTSTLVGKQKANYERQKASMVRRRAKIAAECFPAYFRNTHRRLCLK